MIAWMTLRYQSWCTFMNKRSAPNGKLLTTLDNSLCLSVWLRGVRRGQTPLYRGICEAGQKIRSIYRRCHMSKQNSGLLDCPLSCYGSDSLKRKELNTNIIVAMVHYIQRIFSYFIIMVRWIEKKRWLYTFLIISVCQKQMQMSFL